MKSAPYSGGGQLPTAVRSLVPQDGWQQQCPAARTTTLRSFGIALILQFLEMVSVLESLNLREGGIRGREKRMMRIDMTRRRVPSQVIKRTTRRSHHHPRPSPAALTTRRRKRIANHLQRRNCHRRKRAHQHPSRRERVIQRMTARRRILRRRNLSHPRKSPNLEALTIRRVQERILRFINNRLALKCCV